MADDPAKPTAPSSPADDSGEARANAARGRRLLFAMPWTISLLVHALLILLGFIVTWTVVIMDEDEPPTRIVADFNAMRYEPLPPLELPAETPLDPLTPAMPMTAETPVTDPVPEPLLDPTGLVAGQLDAPALPQWSAAGGGSAASFAGLTTTNARRIVYIIDASGSMVRFMPIVIEELGRSLLGLAPPQSFAVVFFQKNEALVVPPAGRLIPAADAEKTRVMEWIDANVIPDGRSNPVRAFERAIALQPDVIFVLSENITGTGQYEIDQRELLAILDRLNPKGRDGRRPVQINCIQFIERDPLATLRKIAEAHGGPNAFTFLSAQDLGIGSP